MALGVVLLAAGYGTRLYPMTLECPKALLPIGSQALLDPLMDDLRSLPGLSKIVMVTNAKFYGQFEDWRRRRGLPVAVINDGSSDPENRLGAIQDLRLALAQMPPGDDVLVLGTDNLFDWPMQRFLDCARARRPAASIGVYELPTLEEASQCGVVELDGAGRIVRMVEKPAKPPSKLISLCIYYVPAASRARVEEFMRSGGNGDAPGYFVAWLSQQDPVYGCVMEGHWFDIGTPESYARAVDMWTSRPHPASS